MCISLAYLSSKPNGVLIETSFKVIKHSGPDALNVINRLLILLLEVTLLFFRLMFHSEV